MIRTPDQRLRVFVSSTLQEVADERAAARAAIEHLHLVPVMFELGARPHPPAELYRAYLAQSHVFVGLYWERYGWVAPDMEISGLEDEWVLAADHPKLVYIKHSEQREPRLEQLIDRIREDNSTSYRAFSTPDELCELLLDDLAVLLSERFESVAEVSSRSDAPAGSASSSRPAESPLRAVPNPPSPIVGRDVELAELEQLVLRESTRMVTITGPGGSGKTRLAIEVAERLEARHGLRVAFADLTGVRSADLALPTMAAALGIQDAGERTLVEAIATVLRDRPAWLVVDNFEHVIDTAGDLAQILAATDELQLLVTSRQPLRLRWEHEFPLLPLQVPDPVEQRSVDAVLASPAVQLLVERIQRVHPHFVLGADNVDAVAEIARRLDGLPLALELAAARMRVLQPADLLRRLGRRLDVLEASGPDRPVRHHALRSTIAWSHDHLDERERVVFRRMGVFAGGAGIEAVEAICAADDLARDEVLDVIEDLVDKSLLVSAEDQAGGVRLSMLETIREFAVEQLVAAGEGESTWDRHLAWHCELAERAWDGFWGSDMPDWLRRIEREQDNLRSALDHAVGAGDPTLGLRLGASLWPFWDVRGQYKEGERRLDEVLVRASPEPSPERGRALNARGWLIALQGDFDTAMVLMDEGLPMVRAAGDDHRLAWSLAEQGNIAFSLGRIEQTEQLFADSLAIARRLDDVFLIGLGHFGLAYAAFLRGDLESMSRHLDESLALTRRVIQPWGIAWAQFSRGIMSIMLGDTLAAVAPVTESLELRWSISDQRGLAESVQLLATLASAHGEMDWSALLHGAAELQREAVGLTILPFLRPLHDDSVERLGAHFDAAELARRWTLGRDLPFEKLVPEAVARADVLLGTEPV
jgi:predicted ATPase